MKKKTKISIIIGVTLLLVLVIGATYAYFTVNTINEFETPKIEVNAPSVGTVSLKSTNNNLYLNLSRSNMMSSNTGAYYAVTNEIGEASKEENEIEIGQTQVIGLENYNCNYTLNVTYTGDMKDSLTKEGILTLTINDINYDVYSTTFPLTINGTFKNVSSSTVGKITSSLKFLNADESQNELINKNIKLEINVEEFNCTAVEKGETASETIISKNPVGLDLDTSYAGLYRFIGTDVENYIKLGDVTYRIIGIVSEDNDELGLKKGQLKLIKDEGLETTYKWYTNRETNVTWNTGGVDTPIYTYLQSESFINDTSIIPDGYSSLISSVNWYVGEVNTTSLTADDVFDYESDSITVNKNKFGLMYLSDYYYAEVAGGTKNCNKNSCNNWFYTTVRTFTMTYYGQCETIYKVWTIQNNYAYLSNFDKSYTVKPVFYLDENVTVTGSGTIVDPFVVAVN